MNMFQIIVIGMLVALFGGGAYYISRSDSEGVLGQSISGNPIKPTAEQIISVSGVYTCGFSSGCKDDYTLTLNEDGSSQLAAIYEEGAETLAEQGDWVIGKRGYITLNLSGNQSGTYDVPRTILIRSVGTSTLSRIVYPTTLYQDMKNPIFIKSENFNQNP